MSFAQAQEPEVLQRVATPFLRWVGGKTWLLREIEQFLPEQVGNYYEPFLGGAAIFFHLKQSGKLHGKTVLSDINKELTDCFQQVRDDVESVIEYLGTYRNEEEFYYEMRNLVPQSPQEKAARFIYLNRTSFNGVYRVNLKGEYNVPYGYKPYKELFDFDNLRQASRLLSTAEIVCQDFEHSLKSAKTGDLVFLDPPYTVAHENNGFIKYNQKLFAWQDQLRLAKTIETISNKGVEYILTNAAHQNIKNLFGRFGRPQELRRYSVIGGKNAKRGLKSEYVFSSHVRREPS